MHPSRRTIAPLLVLVTALLPACATAPAGTAAVQSGPLPDGGASALAHWIDEACGAVAARAECREAALVRVAEERGIAAAMAVVARLDMTDGEGHAASHMIGIRGYRGMETADDAFASCTTLYQSGCYHGVVQAYFADLRRAHEPDHLTEGMVSALCARYRDQEDGRWSLFQCLHGVGHGAMLVHDNHLPRALEACDLLPTSWEREVCYGGAFMESAMTVLAPHHDHVGTTLAQDGAHDPADPAAAEHAEHAEHDHHGPDHHGRPGAVADPFPPIDADDLHYPCSALDARYQMACYDMQTATMLHLLDYDIAATAAACREAPDEILRSVCHRSLGRDINALTNGEHARSVRMCGEAAAPDRPSCHTGVVKNVIDVSADPASGLAYCELVPAGPEREACFRAVGEQTAVLLPRPEERARFCQALADADRAACAAGAGATLSSADRDA